MGNIARVPPSETLAGDSNYWMLTCSSASHIGRVEVFGGLFSRSNPITGISANYQKCRVTCTECLLKGVNRQALLRIWNVGRFRDESCWFAELIHKSVLNSF